MKLLQVILLFGVLALAASCGSAPTESEPAKPATTAPSNEKEKEAAVAAARDNPGAGIVNAFQKALAANTFRAKLESTLEGRLSVITYEFVAPDRYRMRNGPTEMIFVGQDAFLKTLGSWQKVATSLQNQMKAIRDPQVVEQVKQATDVKFIQPDTLEGKPMLVYEYTSTDLLGVEGKTRAKTWVGMFDGLPYKSEFENVTGSVTAKGVLTWYDYNADIKIEPPFKQ
jgi:hypothetical protein